jgi:acetoin utilization protein AcuC
VCRCRRGSDTVVGMTRATARVVWDPVLTAYNFGPDHPMAPIRLDLTARLCAAFGLFDAEGVEVHEPDEAADDVLATVHDRDFIAAVRGASLDPRRVDVARGLGTEDVPTFRGIHEASARVVDGTLAVTRAVWNGEAAHGVNFCGGLHHAMRDRASGFCVYNDIAVAIQWLLDQGAERIAYVDVDVHHGDGVEAIFYDDPRVLTVSIHETGRHLFPGTGWPQDHGGPKAQGTAANIPLPPGVGDGAWLRAFNATIPPLVRAFRPQIIISQHGVDSHAQDPLAHLALSVEAQREAMDTVHRLSHEVCDGRWVALGGGGYEVVHVVPRAWAHLTAIAAHRPIDPRHEVPQVWRDHVEALFGHAGPGRMGDLPPGTGLWWRSWEMGYDPANEVDRAVMASRQALFPHHGLDVWFD